MNLHGIVSGAIGYVNPFVSATVRRSTGYTTNSDGSRVPTYFTFSVLCQAQALQYNDIAQLDSLNIQGVRRAIYMSGAANGIVRVGQKGGDEMIFPHGTFPEGDTWLVSMALESWPDWSKLAITLQNV